MSFLVGLVVAPAGAALIQLDDLNSTVKIDTSSPSGMNFWTVDGIGHIAQQGLWYRVGDTGPEQPVSSIAAQNVRVSDLNFNTGNDYAAVQYTVANGFQITVVYSLLGGVSSSSDVVEQIRVDNTGTTPLPFHLFQYSNFILGGAGGTPDDTVNMANANTVNQTDGPYVEQTVASTPDHFQVGRVDQVALPPILDSLNDASPTTLNDSMGPVSGNVASAFQWDRTIAPGSSFLISLDKNIVAVPEPASLGLLMLAVPLFLRRRAR